MLRPRARDKGYGIVRGDTDSSNRNVSKSRAVVAGPDKLAMKKRDNAASSSDSAPLPTKKEKAASKARASSDLE